MSFRAYGFVFGEDSEARWLRNLLAQSRYRLTVPVTFEDIFGFSDGETGIGLAVWKSEWLTGTGSDRPTHLNGQVRAAETCAF